MKDQARRLLSSGHVSETKVPSEPDSLQEMRFGFRPSTHPYLFSIDSLRYETGVAYTSEQHHFVRYLETGLPAFRRFYDLHQPSSAVETYFLHGEEDTSITPPSSRPYFGAGRFPWFPMDDPTALGVGEGNLPLNAGHQYWGPVSETRLLFEAQRLERIRLSIEKWGFHWHRMSDLICVYLIIDDTNSNEWRAILRNGVHRPAVLAHLGHEFIPAAFMPHFPREIRLSDIKEWPGVLDGRFSLESAEQIFKSFFRDPHQVLLPGW